MLEVVTAFIPIPDHPRTPKEYYEKGLPLTDAIHNAGFRVSAVQFPMDVCWLHRYLKELPFSVTHSKGDNPNKNSLAYHIVQHQKVSTMCAIAECHEDSDTLVWIDYGICTVPGVTIEVVLDFLKKLDKQGRAKSIVIPGCWPQGSIKDDLPCWRFCGGLIVCPREYVYPLDTAIRHTVMQQILETRNVSWEVNTLAKIECSTRLPIWWYEADHNQTMFTNYPEVRMAS